MEEIAFVMLVVVDYHGLSVHIVIEYGLLLYVFPLQILPFDVPVILFDIVVVMFQEGVQIHFVTELRSVFGKNLYYLIDLLVR